jgi:hypothetical protein
MKPSALALRAFHTAIAAVEIASLGYVWWSALTRRRGRLLPLAVAALCTEGAALVVGRGDCPLGPLQDRLGDPVPLFELALPPKAAKAAVPVLTGVALVGLALLVGRRPPYGRAQ